MEVGAVGDWRVETGGSFWKRKIKVRVKILQQNFHSGRGSRRQRERQIKEIFGLASLLFFVNFYFLPLAERPGGNFYPLCEWSDKLCCSHKHVSGMQRIKGGLVSEGPS